MYRRPSSGQLSSEDFYLLFGGKLSAENRWITLAELIPWEAFESSYAEQFSLPHDDGLRAAIETVFKQAVS